VDPKRLNLRRECIFLHAAEKSGKSMALITALLGLVMRKTKRPGISAVVFVPDEECGLEFLQKSNQIISSASPEFAPSITMFKLGEPTNLVRSRLVESPPDILISTPGTFLGVFAKNQSSEAALPQIASPESDISEFLDLPEHLFANLVCVALDDSDRMIIPPKKFETKQDGRAERRYRKSRVARSAVNALLHLGDPVLVFSSHALNSRLEKLVAHIAWSPGRPTVIRVPGFIPLEQEDED
jgi:superfamily II DNA/RNA helicase